VRRRRLAAAAVAILILAAGPASVLTGCGPAPSARDRNWQQDIAYLARELPRVHVDGLTNVSEKMWLAAAHRLQRQVPHLTNGQVIAGMAQMVALLRDDETQADPSAVRGLPVRSPLDRQRPFPHRCPGR
jgi:hypothetical protein